jgi:hypothetical protein
MKPATWKDLWDRVIQSIRHGETFARNTCSGHNVPMRDDDPRAIAVVTAWLLERPGFAHLAGAEGAEECKVWGGKSYSDVLAEGYEQLGMLPAPPADDAFPVDPDAAGEALEGDGSGEALSELEDNDLVVDEAEVPAPEKPAKGRGGRGRS